MLVNDQDQLLLDALARPHSHLTSSSYVLLSYPRCRLHTSVSRAEMKLDALVELHAACNGPSTSLLYSLHVRKGDGGGFTCAVIVGSVRRCSL